MDGDWSDNTTQPVSYAGPGPVTIYITVFPTNSIGATTPKTTSYFVTAVVNDDTTCSGNEAGDITGTNNFVILPCPTTTLPPAPTNTIGTITNILNGDPRFNQFLGTTNPADIIVTNAMHPADTTTIDWYDAATGGNLLSQVPWFIPRQTHDSAPTPTGQRQGMSGLD